MTKIRSFQSWAADKPGTVPIFVRRRWDCPFCSHQRPSGALVGMVEIEMSQSLL